MSVSYLNATLPTELSQQLFRTCTANNNKNLAKQLFELKSIILEAALIKCILVFSIINKMVRVKNRYIVVRIVPESATHFKALHLKDNQLAKCVLEAVQKYYGQYGLGIVEHGFRVKYCNERTKVAIIRCLHRSHQYVTSILPLITLVGDVRAKFLTIYVGATIIQCNKFIIKHHEVFLQRMVGQIESAKERKDLIKRLLEFDLES